MFYFEKEPIYNVFDERSVFSLFAEHFPKVKEKWLNLLMGIIRLQYASSEKEFTSDIIPSFQAISEREQSMAIRHWVQAGILRKKVSRPIRYRLTDPVPLDDGHKLKYCPFAQQIADEFRGIRPPYPYEILLVWSWQNYPGLEHDVILEVVRQALEINPDAGIKRAEKLLPYVGNAYNRDTTRVGLTEYRTLYLETRELLSILGMDREPRDPELEMYAKWKNDWAFSFDAIRQACSATTVGDPTFSYLDGILLNMRKAVPDGSLDLDAVNSSLEITGELREIRRHVGDRKPVKARISEYRVLRDRYGYEKMLLAADISSKNNKGFDEIGKLLSNWDTLGLSSAVEIKQYHKKLEELRQFIASLYDFWGIEQKPSKRDQRLVRQWLEQGFSRELIFKAAEYAAEADDPPLYTTKVLGQFRKNGIQTPAQADQNSRLYCRQRKEERIKKQREEEADRLRALGALGPYAGNRPASEQTSYDESQAFNDMVEYFMSHQTPEADEQD